MNFEQLLYAEILAQHNSMQKAADVLHISKSGLSIAIGQLESELGVTLFDKSASGTKLTSQGRQLLSTISDVLQLKNNLETMATAMANPQKHQWVRIHYMNTMLKLFITPFINHYFNKFQNIQLDINCHEFDSIVQSLLNGKIDAGFVAINNTHDEVIKALKFTPVFESRLALFCSPNNFLTTLDRPITLDDIKKQTFSIFNDQFHDEIFERLQFQCGPLSLALRVDDAWAMQTAIMKLNTVCFARTLQGDLSSNTSFSKLKVIDISHIIDDHFKLGWLTNPVYPLSNEAKELLTTITAAIKKEVSSDKIDL